MISVVIPTLGRDSLFALIQSLPKPPNLEVIAVVDRKLIPGIVSELGKRFPDVVITQASNPGVNCARNHGVALATHDVIWFLDDDVIAPRPEIVTHVLAHFQNDKVVAVGGAYLTPPEASLDELGYNLLCSLWRHASGESDNEAFLGGCLAIRKSVFQSIGGFDEAIQYGGAETYFVQQLRRWSKENDRLLLYEQRLDVFHRPCARGLEHWAKLAFKQGAQAVATDGMRPTSKIRLTRAKEFISRLSLKERIVLLTFCVPYLGVTRIGWAANILLKSK